MIDKSEASTVFSQWLAKQVGRSYGGGKSKSYGDVSWIRGANALNASLVSASISRGTDPLPAAVKVLVDSMPRPYYRITNEAVAREYFIGVALNKLEAQKLEPMYSGIKAAPLLEPVDAPDDYESEDVD